MNASSIHQNAILRDVSSATEMSSKFHDSMQFNREMEPWGTSSVADLHEMFLNASSLNQDLGSADLE
jgi:hypothetical protein